MRVKPKKRLGQNFLTDKNIQAKLISAYELKKSDQVLEIGAGYGDLTNLIASFAGRVYALEIDPELCGILKENTKTHPNVKIINEDILKFNIRKYFGKLRDKIKVVGNIPYYITTPIIEHMFEYRNKIATIFITTQREFAERITALSGSKKYGSLTCFVQYYAEPKILFSIKKNSFVPAPKVDSCLIRLKIREVPAVKVMDEQLFFKIVRGAFNQRRKTLRNSLASIVKPEQLFLYFIMHNIDPNIRPEDLNLPDFANLANI